MFAATRLPFRLYLIEILHQTTTLKRFILTLLRCILSKFYIKPQPGLKPHGFAPVVSYRNSTSNHNNVLYNTIRAAVVSYRNSTSNHNRSSAMMLAIVVVSYRNSTSNHNTPTTESNIGQVVSYRNSTSNHNTAPSSSRWMMVVSYRNSTSNHNFPTADSTAVALYLIEILHQTTTTLDVNGVFSSCILSKFYIKPQPLLSTSKRSLSCILSKFYIKPQQLTPYRQPGEVVSYRNSTSNHNLL